MKDRDFRPSAETGNEKQKGAEGVTVLHVDDDPNDTALLQAASRKAQLDFQLHNVEDGERAMEYVRDAERAGRKMPSLVLLDLKMPGATGVEILKWIRQHPRLNDVPVVVLSGSELQDDIQRAYAAGANSYRVKPLGFDALVEMIRNIGVEWLAEPGHTSV